MGFTETLRLLVEVDAKGAASEVERFGKDSERAADRSQKALDRWGNKMQSVGAGMATFGAVALVGLKQAGDAASDLNEVASKSSTVFGSAADDVDEFAQNAAKIGLSKRAALEAASGFGNLFDQLGFANEASADMSMQLTTLASDFASFHNADITEVIEAQTAAFRGEYDSLQRFVPTINAAAVQQQAMAETGKDNADALTDAEKAAATYTLMIEGAGKATGDFERTSDSAANQQRQMEANFENLKAGIGQGVLPAMTALLGVTNDFVGGVSKLDAVTGGAAGKVATFGAVALVAAGGLSMIVGKVITARENLGKLRDVFADMPTSTRRAAVALGYVGTALTAIGFLVEHNQKNARNWVDDIVGDVDVTKLGEVRNALREAREELDQLDDESNKGRLFSIGDNDIFATNGDREREDRIDALRETIAELESTEESLAGQQAQTAASFAGASGEISGMTEETVSAIDALKEYTDALAANFDPQFAMLDALEANQEAQRGVTEAQDNLNKAIREHGPASDEAAQAQRDLDQAYQTAAGSAVDLTGASAQLKAGIEAGTVSVADAKASLQRMADQGILTQDVVDAMGREFDIAGLKAVALGGTDPNVNVTTSGIGSADARIQYFLERLGAIPDQITTVVNVVTRNLPGASFFGLNSAEGGIVPEYRAKGGYGPKGTDTIPAWLTPGEMVLNQGQQAQLWQLANGRDGGARGGGDVHIHVAGSILSERDLVRIVRDEFQRGGFAGVIPR